MIRKKNIIIKSLHLEDSSYRTFLNFKSFIAGGLLLNLKILNRFRNS
jgi:hypothetical protein